MSWSTYFQLDRSSAARCGLPPRKTCFAFGVFAWCGISFVPEWSDYRTSSVASTMTAESPRLSSYDLFPSIGAFLCGYWHAPPVDASKNLSADASDCASAHNQVAWFVFVTTHRETHNFLAQSRCPATRDAERHASDEAQITRTIETEGRLESHFHGRSGPSNFVKRMDVADNAATTSINV